MIFYIKILYFDNKFTNSSVQYFRLLFITKFKENYRFDYHLPIPAAVPDLKRRNYRGRIYSQLHAVLTSSQG